MITDEKAIELANAYVDELRKKSPSTNGKTKFTFLKKGKVVGISYMNGVGRQMDYLAFTMSKKYDCKVKVSRKVTYL